jgi:tRNA-dihydrouridine synthase A
MLGREAYHNPWTMADWDTRFYDAPGAPRTRIDVLEAMIPYIDAQLRQYGPLGLKLNSITRHMLGLMQGLPGARVFRQTLSDSKQLALGDARLLLAAAARMPATA